MFLLLTSVLLNGFFFFFQIKKEISNERQMQIESNENYRLIVTYSVILSYKLRGQWPCLSSKGLEGCPHPLPPHPVSLVISICLPLVINFLIQWR